MTDRTHTHCQCDYCTGVDCGQNNPEEYKKEQEALQKKRDEEVRNTLLTDLITRLKTQKKICNDTAKHPIMDEIAKCGWKSRSVQCTEIVTYLESLLTKEPKS